MVEGWQGFHGASCHQPATGARRRDLPITLGSGGGLSGSGSVSVLYTSAELNCIAGRVTCMHRAQISAACSGREKRLNAGGAHCQQSTLVTLSILQFNRPQGGRLYAFNLDSLWPFGRAKHATYRPNQMLRCGCPRI